MSECLATTQFSRQTSSVAARAACGQRVTTTRRHLREPDTGRWPARDGALRKMGLSPARVGVGGAARENVFRSSVRAVSRIEVPRPETYTPSRDESNRGSKRTQNAASAQKKGEKYSNGDGKSAQRAGIARKRARRHK